MVPQKNQCTSLLEFRVLFLCKFLHFSLWFVWNASVLLDIWQGWWIEAVLAWCGRCCSQKKGIPLGSAARGGLMPSKASPVLPSFLPGSGSAEVWGLLDAKSNFQTFNIIFFSILVLPLPSVLPAVVYPGSEFPFLCPPLFFGSSFFTSTLAFISNIFLFPLNLM